MKSKLIQWLGGVPKEQYDDLKEQLAEGVKESIDLREELLIAEMQLQDVKAKPVVDVEVLDPAPTAVEERKMFIAEVAGFHHKIMKPRLLKFISDARGQFEELSRNTYGFSQEQYDIFLKGTLNAYWLIFEWGEGAINEQIANQMEARDISDAERKELQEKVK